MKKVFLTLFVLIMFAIPAFAAKWTAVNRVENVGEMIIKKNSLPYSIRFAVVNGAPDNTDAVTTNIIQVGSENLKYTSNDNELAYVLAYELSSIINNNAEQSCNKKAKRKARKTNKTKFAFTNSTAKTEDNDILSLDLVINSGYNPLAAIAVLSKMSDLDCENLSENTPNISRSLFMYDYLSYNYPTKVKIGYNSQEYTVFLSSIEPQISERKFDRAKLNKYKQTQSKLRIERDKQLLKYKAVTGLSAWNITYDLMKSLTEPEEI